MLQVMIIVIIEYSNLNVHYIGGWCFLPTNLSEGTRLFEMEVLLSVGQRTEIKKPPINDLVCNLYLCLVYCSCF